MRTFQFIRFKEFRIEKPIPLECDLDGGKKIPEAEIPAKIWKLLQTTGGSVANGDASGQDFNVIRSLKENGNKPADIYETFLASPRGKDAEKRKPGHVEDYVRRTLNAGVAPRTVNVDFSVSGNGCRWLKDVRPKAIEWLWPGYIVLNKTNLFAGDSEKGKSAILVDIAARLSRGKPMPYQKNGIGGNTLFVSAEDTDEDILIPRLEAAKADVGCICSMSHLIDDKDGNQRTLTFPNDLEFLRSKIEEYGVKFVVIDPISAYTDKNMDLHKEPDVRKLLNLFDQIATRMGCTILLVNHLRKNGEGTLKEKVAGTGALTASPRQVIAVRELSDGTCVFGVLKTNITERKETCLQYRTEGVCLDNGSGKINTVRIDWMGEINYNIRAEEITIPGKKPPRDMTVAKNFLKRMLNNGRSLSPEKIFKRAKELDLSENVIKSAAKALHVIGQDKDVWKLPDTD